MTPGRPPSISLTSELEQSLLIIDELKGRKAARELGITITGSLGVLVIAKRKGMIVSIQPIIEKIKQTNFRISKSLIAEVLHKVDER